MKIRAEKFNRITGGEIIHLLNDKGIVLCTLTPSSPVREAEEAFKEFFEKIVDEVVERINRTCGETQKEVLESMEQSLAAIHARHIDELRKERQHSHNHCAEIAELKRELKKEQFEVCRLQKIFEDETTPAGYLLKIRAENAEKKLKEIRQIVCRWNSDSSCDGSP